MNRILLLALFTGFTVTFGQKKKPETTAQPAPPAQSLIEGKTAGMKKFPGYFEFYYDEKQDKIHLVIDKFDTEFLYVESLTAGVGSNDIGLDRNQLGQERVVKFQRRGPKVLLTEINLRYRAISNSAAERKAVEEAFAQSVLFGFTVSAEENGKVLVDITDFLIQDAHDVVGSLRNTQQGSYSLDKSRSALYLSRIKNFPQNSEFESTLTFTGNATGGYIRSVTPTASSVTVREHFSFVQLPDNQYKPRKFDPRAGYFSFSYYDYATPISEPIEKKFITRHRLEKKDPNAAMSEAVEPIVYYMDPGAPEPIRSALMDGARWWNQAFEAAGYKDAFRVEVLPEDADPMDVRYNVINWVHRSTRGWSYGASVTDPRTGEIIKGHVTLGSLRVRQDFLIAEGLLAPYEEGKPVSAEMEKMALQRLRQLAAHEVGHTLGISHAYSSSSENFASVMDYPHPLVKITDGKIDLGNAYDSKIGSFDKVAIAYGYADFPDGADENKLLNDFIQKSLNDGLTFLSDQDARPLGGAHPYAHLWDNGADPTDELNRVLDIRSIVFKNFGERNIREGAPMATLEEVFVPMYFFHRYQTEAASKVLGGLNYRYALRGDGQPITSLLSPDAQWKALKGLLRSVSPEVLGLPENLIQSIPPRPLGYSRHRELIKTRTDLAFDPLAAAESASDMTFSLIFHPARVSRLVEHNARDARQPALDKLIDEIFKATVNAGRQSGYAGAVQMTVNYSMLTNLIRLALNKDASSEARAIALYKLNELKGWLNLKSILEPNWRAHYEYLGFQIQQAFSNPEAYKQETLLASPPGQPIGDEDWH
jgi:Met-zincin/Domain of unknown function (DUF5117)